LALELSASSEYLVAFCGSDGNRNFKRLNKTLENLKLELENLYQLWEALEAKK
jgi:hypothetical protein